VKLDYFIDNSIPDILCIMFADDVTSCAQTVNRLQQQLNIVDQFCTSAGMEVNRSKTQLVVFRDGGPLKQNERWTLRGEYMQVTSV